MGRTNATWKNTVDYLLWGAYGTIWADVWLAVWDIDIEILQNAINDIFDIIFSIK